MGHPSDCHRGIRSEHRQPLPAIHMMLITIEAIPIAATTHQITSYAMG